MSTPGERIKMARNKQGLHQTELAEAAKTNSKYISYLENGKKRLTYDMAVRLSDPLNVTPEYLIGKASTPHASESLMQAVAITEDMYFLAYMERYLNCRFRFQGIDQSAGKPFRYLLTGLSALSSLSFSTDRCKRNGSSAIIEIVVIETPGEKFSIPYEPFAFNMIQLRREMMFRIEMLKSWESDWKYMHNGITLSSKKDLLDLKFECNQINKSSKKK